MEKVNVSTDFVSTKEYPYAICVMLTGPFDPTYVIHGDASNVREYWRSHYNIEYAWLQYRTAEEMKNGLDAIPKKHTPFSYWQIVHVKDCKLKEKPQESKGKKVESLSEDEATSEQLTYKTKSIFSMFD